MKFKCDGNGVYVSGKKFRVAFVEVSDEVMKLAEKRLWEGVHIQQERNDKYVETKGLPVTDVEVSTAKITEDGKSPADFYNTPQINEGFYHLSPSLDAETLRSFDKVLRTCGTCGSECEVFVCDLDFDGTYCNDCIVDIVWGWGEYE